jgi:formylglycine-generating enzyme required for sulfatase activity
MAWSNAATETALKYRAFISYSHADASWAKWLHRGLEAFRIDTDLMGRETSTGTIPKSLHPIFRDRDDFNAGHALTDQTLAALDDSAALLVICSTASAKSRYVNEEVRLFKFRHPRRPVIPLIVGGKPNDAELECFPPSLKFKIDAAGQTTDEPIELLAADPREESDGRNLALAKVTATLLGVSSDDVFRRAERERRAAMRRKRRVQALVGALGLLLVAAGVGWLNQAYLREQYYRFIHVRPYLLSADAARALKAKDVFKECKDCPEMVVVPAGSFLMGSAQGEGRNNEHPQHGVIITKPFAVSKFEVTFDQWDACVAHGGCTLPAPDAGWERGTRPVINVSWDGFQQYVTWLSKLTGGPYRLLSEAEWEYAARAGTSTPYSFGDNEKTIGEYAWYANNASFKTHPVGEKKPNAFGLYDMHGNVWEWVQDCEHESYSGAPTDGTAWITDGCEARVLRGGSWLSFSTDVDSAHRYGEATDYRVQGYVLGFRLARAIAP